MPGVHVEIFGISLCKPRLSDVRLNEVKQNKANWR